MAVGIDYFTLFDVPVRCVQDQKIILERYYALSRTYHPDQYISSNHQHLSEDEQLELSAAVNKAKAIFMDRNKTIEYILQRNDRLKDAHSEKLPPDFLMDMLEMNEAIADAKLNGDSSKMEKLKNSITEKETMIEKEALPAMLGYQEGLPNETEMLNALSSYYHKQKYIRRMWETMI